MNYKKIYEDLIDRSKKRELKNQYTEKHHIVPLCLGGKNNLNNIVRLTPREHFLAHLLLMKIYPNEHKLVYAAMKMTRGRNGINSSRKYEWLRKKYSLIRKKLIQENSPTKNKRWISNLNETILIDKIRAEELVKKGEYVFGKRRDKIFFCEKCSKILKKLCKGCSLSKKNNKTYLKNKKTAEELFENFIKSNSLSVTEFAKRTNTSQPRLTKLWSKYVDEYRRNKKQGRTFKKSFERLDFLNKVN